MPFACHRLLASLVLLLAFAPAPAHASDPCDLAGTGPLYSWSQAMACYRSVPFTTADRDNAVNFIRAARERSDLREVFDAQNGWRARLETLATRTFDSDFDLQMALTDDHKEFRNPHWRYRRVGCYAYYLGAFMPFDFGSTVTRAKNGKQAQIVFIEAAPFLPDAYQGYTGIDARKYIGMKVVSVNGIDAMQYFRDYGRNVYRFDANDGENFNEVLQNAAYSMRVSPTHDMLPTQASDTYVLETTGGKRTTIEMPWVFATRNTFGFFQWDLPHDSAEFAQSCQWLSNAAYYATASLTRDQADAGLPAEGRSQAESEFVQELAQKREAAQRLRKKYGGQSGVGYFEVSPGNLNLALTTVVPRQNGASAFAIDDKATFLRTADFTQDWKQQVIEATDYACTHTERLVIDMRNNGGGYIDQIAWLTAFLFPERTLPGQNALVGRFLASNAGRNELAQRMEEVVQAEFGPGVCWWGYEAACFLDPATGERLTAQGWYTSPITQENRQGVTESLTRLVGFSHDRPEYLPGTDAIACPGKFTGTKLAVLTNGTGASAGYFFPELIRNQSVFVSAGGYVGEPLVSGIARGGAVWGMNDFEAAIEQIFKRFYYNGTAVEPLPYLIRNADSFIEQPGSYTLDGSGLFAEAQSYGNTWIPVWADSPETDGYVYRKVLNALQSYKPRH